MHGVVLEADIFVLLSYLFGLSSAPFLFTKIFLPLVCYLRGLGFHLVLYLDEGAGCEKDFLSTQYCSNIIRSDLVRAGA